jgi:flagella basal body P-ring formation protein FlgA
MKKYFVALALLGSPCASVHASTLPTIAIVSEVSVLEPKIYLGNLLTAESRSVLPSTEQVDRALVSPSPEPGKTKTFESREVLQRLAETGITGDRYLIRIPDQIRVGRQAQTLSSRDIEEKVRTGFLPGLPWEDVRLVEITIPEGDVVLPAGKLALTYEQPVHTDMARPFYLGINFAVDGQIVKRGYWKTVLAISQTVAVAARELGPSDRIGSSDVKWEKRALLSTLRPTVNRPGFFDNKKLKASIAPGQIVTEDLFQIIPLVNRGDSVLIVFESEKFHISAKGQSMAAGVKGDRIRVMNVSSKKELTAEIVDQTTVKVVF